MAIIAMNPNVFRKGDATSCLVLNKTWDEILDKPEPFKTLGRIVLAMVREAEETEGIDEETKLGELKEIINKVLLSPLRMEEDEEVEPSGKDDNAILADAFWDEITEVDKSIDWESVKEAIQRIYEMQLRIKKNRPLTLKDTFRTVKENFNSSVIEPLQGKTEEGE